MLTIAAHQSLQVSSKNCLALVVDCNFKVDDKGQMYSEKYLSDKIVL